MSLAKITSLLVDAKVSTLLFLVKRNVLQGIVTCQNKIQSLLVNAKVSTLIFLVKINVLLVDLSSILSLLNACKK